MTKNPEEENTIEQNEDTLPVKEEPSRVDQPTEDLPAIKEEPTKTEEQTEDPPATVEEPDKTEEEEEKEEKAGGEDSGNNKQDDGLDNETGTGDMEGDGVTAESKMENGGAAVAEENGSGDQATDITDGGAAVPESEQEKAVVGE